MTRVRWYLPPLLLAISPLAIVIGANLGTVPLRGVVVARSLLLVAAATVILLSVLRLLQRDLAARAAWLSSFLILFNLYGASARGLRVLGLQILAPDPLFAVPYVLTSAVIAAIASRPWEVRPRDPTPLTIVAALFLLVGLLPAAGNNRQAAPSWRPHADRVLASALSHPPKAGFTPSRDLYYVVLDSLGSANTLRRSYEVDLEPFVAALRARGFYVADGARSNYAQTYLSIASALNMSYLDDLASAVGPGTTDRDPLGYLIQENALMRMASQAGYRVVAIGSNYVATQQFPHADVCVCSLRGLDEVEVAAIAQTPLAATGILSARSADPFAAHRRKIIDSFDALEDWRRAPRRTFVFAHILVPHPPFVLARDGSPLQPSDRPFSLGESDPVDGPRHEYISGYREQSLYALTRMLEIIDALLRQPGPRPAIIVHGDHGPATQRRTLGTSETRIRERMDIFAAYYFPDEAAALYPTITPVNAARILARQYLGVEMPLLPDRVQFSTLERPYEFRPVPDPQPSR